MQISLIFLIYMGFRIIYFVRNNNNGKTSKWMYVISWIEFGLIGTLLARRFLLFFTPWWTAFIVSAVTGMIGYYITTTWQPEKEEWEEEINEIGNDRNAS